MFGRHVVWLLFSSLCHGRPPAQAKLEADEVVPRLLSLQEMDLMLPHHQRSEHSKSEYIFILLPAFGNKLYLNLTRDFAVFSKNIVVEERLGNQSVVVRRLTMDQRCFYSGFIINQINSVASLSTCAGLTGLIQMDQDLWFIQPADQQEPSTSFSGLKHQLVRHQSWTETKPRRDAEQPVYCGLIKEKQKGRRSKQKSLMKRDVMKLEQVYTLETVVVADSDMVQYHGAEGAQRFLLTVMNMVNSLFQHPSLGVQINIRVTKLLLLHNRPENLSVSHHGQRSLESFCHWQHGELGMPLNFGPNKIRRRMFDIYSLDTAVLVTRTDFCVHKDQPCDTVGIAYLGGVCSAKRKCVVAEDNGLNLAFTIAHELGHNMGMNHDDHHTNCTSHSHIMSGEWIKGRNPSELFWSSCSRRDLENFLRSEASSCLRHTDPRNSPWVPLSSKLPGMHYSVTEQCQILFGANATFCSEMQDLMCAGLWCLEMGETSCKTKLDPPLEGTECGTDKWCRAGQCVRKTPIPQHVDGDWSLWSQWSICSPTCGTGVQFRQRKCDNPPPGPDGRHCPESSVEHRACEGPACPRGAPGFRDLQCLSLNRHVGVLTAVINDERPCVLFCSSVGQHVPVLKADRVMDGTPCGPFESDLCVNGSCKRIGCDGIVGSSAEEDVCGVCNGHGRSCKIVKGEFNHTKGMGYIEAVVIPAGARRIKVVEDRPLHSFLALKDSSRRSINGNWKIELPGDFQLAGTTVRYVRRGLWEKMSAKGPTKTPLHLMVLLFYDQSYGIHYEYTMSLNTSLVSSSQTPSKPDYLYIWAHSNWQDCPVPCGIGERRTVVSCVRIVRKNMEVVNDSYCQSETRPLPKVQLCNTQPCNYRWVTGDVGPCSVSCGKGFQQREVFCIYSLQNGSAVKTKEQFCGAGKPAEVQDCETPSCLNMWDTSEWSQVIIQCSSKCGEDVRRRTVTCRDPQGLCDLLSKPDQEEPCEKTSRCYEWKFGDWSKCSATCGRGVQSRVVQCMHRDTGRHGDNCPSSLRPPTYRPCQQNLCSETRIIRTSTHHRV
ncbi:A disintegrin and metalloproteinase with thrombospondin motifs 17 [Austrofundulus limnaeus]|uniref:A disintegrin and metalloproteinase with thrombospondin motifs 17 n=1 Tax=Austrofundulus limnaeus TaxID=52670 RepID=A0A2I4D908_AUSLI|nr:PREDICTED: A disintegrin and metalloproteinase with thrombospondin motifs 17 [Austrofundulus limnaeus]